MLPLRCHRRQQERKLFVTLVVSLASIASAVGPLAFTSRVHNIQTWSRIRAGYTEGDSSAGKLEDQTLDEYIEFLLAAADGMAKEEDNPLIRRLGTIWKEDIMALDEDSDLETMEISETMGTDAFHADEIQNEEVSTSIESVEQDGNRQPNQEIIDDIGEGWEGASHPIPTDMESENAVASEENVLETTVVDNIVYKDESAAGDMRIEMKANVSQTTVDIVRGEEESSHSSPSLEASSRDMESQNMIASGDNLIETLVEENVFQKDETATTENVSVLEQESTEPSVHGDEVLISEQTVSIEWTSQGMREHDEEEAHASEQSASMDELNDDRDEDNEDTDFVFSDVKEAASSSQEKDGAFVQAAETEVYEKDIMDEYTKAETIIESKEEHVVESLKSAHMGTDVQKQTDSEEGFAEQAPSVLSSNATKLGKGSRADIQAEQISSNFFLGPSAVEEGPLLSEDESAEVDGMNISHKIGLRADFDKITHLHDLRSTAPLPPFDVGEMTFSSMMHTTSKFWGKITAHMIGLGSKAKEGAGPNCAESDEIVEADSTEASESSESKPSSEVITKGIQGTSGQAPASQRIEKHFANAWGRLTAALLGIGHTEEMSASRNGFSRDYDHIYRKYFANYTPDTAYREFNLSKAANNPSNSDDTRGVQNKPLQLMQRLVASLKNAMLRERIKPIFFFSEHNQTTSTTTEDAEDLDVSSRDEVVPVSAAKEALNSGDDAFATVGEENGQPRCTENEELGANTTLLENVGNQSGTEDSALVDVANISGGTITEDVRLEEENDDGEMGSKTQAVDAESITIPEILGTQGNADAVDKNEGVFQQERVADDSISAQFLGDSFDQNESFVSITKESAQAIDDNSEGDYDAFDDMLSSNVNDAGFHVEEIDAYDEYYEDYEDEAEIRESIESSIDDPIDGLKGLMTPMDTDDLSFVSKFMMAQGLNFFVVLAILSVEWFRLYLSPLVDTLDWFLSKAVRSSPRLDKVRWLLISSLRGGSDAGVVTDDQETNGSDTKGTDMGTSMEVADKLKEEEEPLRTVRTRPNALYRHLFAYGQVGQILIMECVMFVEWVNTYTPMVAACFTWSVKQTFPSLLSSSRMSEVPVSQTTGFVGADGSVVRGAKKKKSQRKKEDQKALSQLSRVGDVTQAKYRFLSETFMMRHGLGQFATQNVPAPMVARKEGRKHAGKKRRNDTVEEFESDAEWIVSALTQDEARAENTTFDNKIISSATGSDQSFTTSSNEKEGRRRKKKKRPSITDVKKITSADSGKNKRAGPRLSDMDSGVMGRIRAAGANSLVGRNILGAYPGDAPSPNEAASPFGLFELAERYGYGDWSDGDDCGGSDGIGPAAKRRRRRPKALDDAFGDIRDDFTASEQFSSRSSRRRNNSNVQFGFEFGAGSSSKASSGKSKKKKRTPSSEVSRRKMSHNAIRRSTSKSVAEAGVETIEKSAKRRHRNLGLDIDTENRKKSSDSGRLRKKEPKESGESIVAKAALSRLKEKNEKSPKDET